MAGPTAVGKTALGLALAKAVGGEIVSADSMQVYRHMDIGTAKIRPDEMEGVPHHLIDVADPWDTFDVTAYQRLAREAIRGIHSRGRIPILTGGTGFYIQAVLRGVDFGGGICASTGGIDREVIPDAGADIVHECSSGVDDRLNGGSGIDSAAISPFDSDAAAVLGMGSAAGTCDGGGGDGIGRRGGQHGASTQRLRDTLLEEAAARGNAALHARLREIDPASADAIHPNNVRRVARAIEFFMENGSPISVHNAAERAKPPVYDTLYYVLTCGRKSLYERIDRRVDAMMAQGLPDEVRGLRDMGCGRGMTSMQALGYKELFAWLDGECTLEDAAGRIKTDTRHYAKRQLTWFGREKDAIWLDREDFRGDDGRVLERILDDAKSNGMIA
ncbi:MAG: tRNA (adenosine(37)-N6)-dimethylallyltransferase MiaA [Lachnospiraceae bacterium]|nr:tRNA (adenosine(37)-N6)-dimethylallyltransferase MiaA [Lachnospiraceae bacterium]